MSQGLPSRLARFTATCTLLAVLVLAGCGGDGDDSEDGGNGEARVSTDGGDGGQERVLTTPSGYVVPSGLDRLLGTFETVCFPDTGSAECIAFMKKYCGEPDKAPTAFCNAAEAEVFAVEETPAEEGARPPEEAAKPPEEEPATPSEAREGEVIEAGIEIFPGDRLVPYVTVDLGGQEVKAAVDPEGDFKLSEVKPGDRVKVKPGGGPTGWVVVGRTSG